MTREPIAESVLDRLPPGMVRLSGFAGHWVLTYWPDHGTILVRSGESVPEVVDALRAHIDGSVTPDE